MGEVIRNEYGYPTIRQLNKEQKKMNRKNWFELIKAMITAGLGYLAGLFL